MLLAAVTHATWNYYAKKAAASRHMVWLYSIGLPDPLRARSSCGFSSTTGPDFESTSTGSRLLAHRRPAHGLLRFCCRRGIAYRICRSSIRSRAARGRCFRSSRRPSYSASRRTSLSFLGVALIVGGIPARVGARERPSQGAESRRRLRAAHRRVHRRLHDQRWVGGEGADDLAVHSSTSPGTCCARFYWRPGRCATRRS